jgi:hypothetical protein
MHVGQLAVPPETVRELVNEQFPRWWGLAITAVSSGGTVNTNYRIGERLAARFPLQPGEAGPVRGQLEAEAAAACELAGRTRFPTPEPMALGEPGAGYPLPRSVQTWLPGITAIDEDHAAADGTEPAQAVLGPTDAGTYGLATCSLAALTCGIGRSYDRRPSPRMDTDQSDRPDRNPRTMLALTSALSAPADRDRPAEDMTCQTRHRRLVADGDISAVTRHAISARSGAGCRRQDVG